MRVTVASGADPNLQQAGTENVWQILQTFLTFVTYAKKDPRPHELFPHDFAPERLLSHPSMEVRFC